MNKQEETPPATSGRTIRYLCEAALAYLAYGIMRVLPVRAASYLGGFILRWVGPHLKSAEIARGNLKRAFPNKSAEDREEIMRAMWENLGRMVGEYPHLSNLKPRVEIVGGEHLARGTGRAKIFFGGHISNWEVAGIAALAFNVNLFAVYRRPNNKFLDGLLYRARESVWYGQIAKSHRGAREIMAVLKRGDALGLLVDQKLNTGGVPVPFFGAPAMTAPTIAHLALRMPCDVHPFRVERLPGARFRITIEAPLRIVRSGDHSADVLSILTQTNSRLENWIKATPAEWLWIYRRWDMKVGER